MGNCTSGGNNDVAVTKRNSSSKRNSNADNSQKQTKQNPKVEPAEQIEEKPEPEEPRNSYPKQNGDIDSHNRESQSSNQHELVAGDVQPQDPEPVQADDQADEAERDPKRSDVGGGGQTNSKRGQVIDREHALTQACGDEEFLVEILGDVIAEKEETCSKIRVAIQENDHKALAETAHTIKGSALNLALNALASVAKDLEQLGKDLKKEEDEQKLLRRSPYLEEMEFEYQRIEKYVAEEWPDG